MITFVIERAGFKVIATRSFTFNTREEGAAFMEKYGLSDRVIDIF